MSGTKAGGAKCRETNLRIHGEDFYKRIGSKGGKWCGPKGFALDPERAKNAGRKGGLISKRGKAKKCKVCDLTRPQKERMIPNNMEWYPNVEKWFIEHEPETDTYFIVAGYDSVYANLMICNIKYCPRCGRKLK